MPPHESTRAERRGVSMNVVGMGTRQQCQVPLRHRRPDRYHAGTDSSETAGQNVWGIFSRSGPDDGRIIWVYTGRPGQASKKAQEEASG